MINIDTETVISLDEARSRLPGRREGKRPTLECLYRWTTKGCRGVILESIQVGATRCTSREALQRFFDRLTTGLVTTPAAAETTSPKRSKRGGAEAAEKRLQAAGA